MKNNMIIVMMSLAFLVITHIQAEQPTITKSNISRDDVYGFGLNEAIKFERNALKRKMTTTENLNTTFICRLAEGSCKTVAFGGNYIYAGNGDYLDEVNITDLNNSVLQKSFKISSNEIFNIKHQNIFYDNDLRKNVAFSGMQSTLTNLLHINANFGLKAFYWKPNKRPGGFLSFKTEGLGLYKFSGSFGLWKFDIIDVDYEGPIQTTEHQKEMFIINDKKSEGLEKYTFGVKLDPIAKRLFPIESGMIGFVLRRILSIKFTYSNELFYGYAKCENNFYYVPKNISFNSASSDDYINVSKNDIINFKTYFTDKLVSVLISSDPDPDGWDVRVGFFSETWRRPSDYWHHFNATEQKYYLFENSYKVQGIWLGLITTNQWRPGHNFDVNIRWSGPFNESITNADGDLGDKIYNEDKSWLNYVGGHIIYFYNMYFGRSSYLRVGIDYDRRHWIREYPEEEGEEDQFGIIERDEFYTIFGQISWKF